VNVLHAVTTSPLDAVLRRHGATMIIRHGRCVAAHFGSAASEAAVCLSTVGIADRSDRTTFELRGAPQDVALALAALRDRAWSMRTSSRSAIVRCEHQDASACAAAVIPADGALVVDVSDRYAAIAVVGPRSAALLNAVAFAPGGRPLVLRDRRDGLELLTEAADGVALWNQLLEAGARFRAACVGLDALEHLAASHRGEPNIRTVR
jgi:glycine cleavage system aminomethyltransferase T